MPDTTSPLQTLVQAALQSVAQSKQCFEGLRLTAAFDPSWNGSITATLVATRPLVGPIWVDLQLDTASESRTKREFLDFVDFAAAMQAVASLFPGAVVRADSVQVKAGKSTSAKLEPVAVQAWHEVFGQPIPSLEELAERRIASKERLQALLRTGPDGVASFNRLPRIERTQADIRNTDLSQCRLDGIDFAGANMEKADLSGASLVEADFGGKTQAEFAPPRIKGVKAVGADLSRAMLGDAQAADADFSRAVLNDAHLSVGSFLRARFAGADLSGASLFLSDLRGADFMDANLKGVQFAGAKLDEQTRWPKRFHISAEMDWRGKAPDPRRSREKTTAKPAKASGSRPRQRKAKS